MRGNEKHYSDSPCVTAHTNPGNMLNELVFCWRQKYGPTLLEVAGTSRQELTSVCKDTSVFN
jgi:hypothetical protein